MGKVKRNIAGKVIKGAVGLVPGGSAVKLGLKGAGALGRKFLGKRGVSRRSSRGLNINKYVRKITKAKMDARLMKIKLSALRGI